MKISKIVVNDHLQKRLGLERFSMTDLGSVVLLVGENGCGKSRLLESVHWMLLRVRDISYASLLSIRQNRDNLDPNSINQIFYDDGALTAAGFWSDREVFDRLARPLDGLEIEFSPNEDQKLSFDTFSVIHQAMRAEVAPTATYLDKLAVGVPKWKIENEAMLVSSPLTYIEDICARHFWRSKEDPEIGMHTSDSSASDRYESLVSHLKELVGMTLTEQDGNANLDGMLLKNLPLSRGQQSLIKIAVLVHSGIMQGAPVPIILDEPERYLHPSSTIGLVESIRSRMPNAQLWIATHSLSLAAHLHAIDPRSVWFGRRGKFERSGLLPERVVSGLLGSDNGAHLISDFCTSSHRFAGASFSAECLAPPGVVSFREGDEQIRQIADFLSTQSGCVVRVVDYGAGSGRLLEGLSAILADEVMSRISYFAIEPNGASATRCDELTSAIFRDGKKRVFHALDEFIEAEGEVADVVVLTNVLHEMSIETWEATLSQIVRTISSDGSLLIVEDTTLPHGELAHINGFLVLEAPALCMLFKADRCGSGVVAISSQRGGARLQATAFARSAIKSPDTGSIISALNDQLSNLIDKTLEMRRSVAKPNYKLGRQHAYYTQSIANLVLALERLRTPLNN